MPRFSFKHGTARKIFRTGCIAPRASSGLVESVGTLGHCQGKRQRHPRLRGVGSDAVDRVHVPAAREETGETDADRRFRQLAPTPPLADGIGFHKARHGSRAGNDVTSAIDRLRGGQSRR